MEDIIVIVIKVNTGTLEEDQGLEGIAELLDTSHAEYLWYGPGEQ